MAKLVTSDVFWSRVDLRGPEECAPYVGPGTRTRDGHVRVSIGGSKIYAHRFAFFDTYGVWPYVACHLCHHPSCCQPTHIVDGDHALNALHRDLADRRTSRLPKRPQHWSSRVSATDIQELIEARAHGIRATVLATEYGISAETVRSVWRRAATETGLRAAA